MTDLVPTVKTVRAPATLGGSTERNGNQTDLCRIS